MRCRLVRKSQQIQNKQVWFECHTINYLLTSITRVVVGNTGPPKAKNRIVSVTAKLQLHVLQQNNFWVSLTPVERFHQLSHEDK